MAIGPGKYDAECTWVRQRLGARAVLLVVAGGIKGQGFSVQGTPNYLVNLPAVLREVAQIMERDTLSAQGSLAAGDVADVYHAGTGKFYRAQIIEQITERDVQGPVQ